MVRFSAFFVGFVTLSGFVSAAPSWHNKRIAQVIADSTTKWEAACSAAGGGLQCNPISVSAFSTLLAAAGPCDQQNNADQMIDLAKQLNNDRDMISFAQIFAQQPRNTPTSQSVPYCQQAPKNSELDGLFQCQFQGADPTTFVGGIKVGGAGTIPFGHSAVLSPAGSCAAHPAGPIADGTQLVDQVSTSGAGGATGTPPNTTSTAATASPTYSADPTSTSDAYCPGTTSAAPLSSSSASFALQNGEDAQALNAKFASLDSSSTCEQGDQACIGTAFAQCVGGSYVQSPCAPSLICAALPLLNLAGTSITCTTEADAAARIAETGAEGGITGS
ncbi:hypothetical protein BV25DRAFT_1956048 [Artomyces pyxidatus]|uniref:Uncharacterized protein n=1 Tax=Artomyces pyxidatus TaxID=48021 RepID=A0ACB8SVV5_9AGAM|nr:hypothetical protein BV25DRAFT_1956048 [Artomyces pyxidatus]